jgi:hypothetical protein
MTDYAELVERLRFGIDPHDVVYGWQSDCLVAADAIEALVKERDRYKANQRCQGCVPGLSQNYVARKEGGE